MPRRSRLCRKARSTSFLLCFLPLILGASGSAEPRKTAPAGGLSAEQQAEIDLLEAIGYVGETPLDEAAKGSRRGVTIHDASRAYAGLSLYTSGHGPVATLIDMEGRVVHRWERSPRDVWPATNLQKHPRSTYFRRAWPFENGDLLVVFTGLGLVRLDAESNVVWKGVPGAHHDLEVQPNGDIYLLSRRARIVRWMNVERPVLEDFVVVVNEQGVVKRRVSVLEAFRGTPFQRLLRKRKGDVTHNNSIQVLDGSIADRIPAFAAGNVLLSMRAINVIAVLDMQTGKITWAKTGVFQLQHDPSLVANGNLLIFDNGNELRKQSRVLEIDPTNMSSVWTYPGDRADPFFTSCCGLAQRFPNGNTLITSADTGRAIEVTRSGDIVWEFLTPHLDVGYVKALFEFVRLPADFPIDWANAGNVR